MDVQGRLALAQHHALAFLEAGGCDVLVLLHALPILSGDRRRRRSVDALLESLELLAGARHADVPGVDSELPSRTARGSASVSPGLPVDAQRAE